MNRLYFSRFRLTKKLSWKCRGFPYYHLSPMQFLLISTSSQHTVSLLLIQWTNPHWHVIVAQSPWSTLGVTLALDLLQVWINGQWRVSTIIVSCKAGLPGIPLFSICSSLPSSNPEATDLFTVSIVLPFPERHVVGIIQCSAFSDWLLSFNRVHISFLHVFSWLHSSYLNNISLSGCTTVYLTFTYWRTSWLHPSFHHYE